MKGLCALWRNITEKYVFLLFCQVVNRKNIKENCIDAKGK